jgi:hypothetical protein
VSGNFTAGVVDTGGNLPQVSLPEVANLPAGIVDTDGKSATNFRQKVEMILMLLLGALGKMIHEKTCSKKSRDTVPLSKRGIKMGSSIRKRMTGKRTMKRGRSMRSKTKGIFYRHLLKLTYTQRWDSRR